jgi:hypothetical protein
MPNLCENSIEITGTEEDIKALREWMGNDFDFNKIIPMPAEIDDGKGVGMTPGNTPVTIDEETKIFHYAYRNDCPKNKSNKDLSDSSGRITAAMAFNNGYQPCEICILNSKMKFDRSLEEGAALVKKYGYDNWYDWCIANWGTKWRADGVNADWGKTFVNVFFFTAWSPPEPIYKAIVAKFPNSHVAWHYSESGNCFSGNFETGEEFDYPDPEEDDGSKAEEFVETDNNEEGVPQ